jgi:hypothetical protein
MHPRSPLVTLLAALALVAVTTPETHAAPKYNECQFSKRKAKKKRAPVCKKDIHKSTWIVVSGEWREKLTMKEARENASFSGTGEANFRAGGLSGRSPFPSKKRPVVSMVSTAMFDHLIEFSSSSTGGWTTKDRYYGCNLTLGQQHAPFGFGGIFMLAGKNIRVQWPVGATGFGCGSGPYGTPGAEFPTPVETYKVASFRNRRLAYLPIAFDHQDESEGFSARRTIDGVARMRRYR